MARTAKELAEAYERCFNARDLGGIVALYEPGAMVTRPGREVRGTLDIEAAFKETLAKRAGVTLRLVEATAHQIENLCLTVSKWSATWTNGDGAVQNRDATTVEVARQQPDGTWRYILDDPITLNG